VGQCRGNGGWPVGRTGAGVHASLTQRERAGAGQVYFVGRAGLMDLAHEEKWFFFFPMHFPYNIEVKLILEKILREHRKLWKFSWRKIRIFGTTFVLATLTKGQPNENEKMEFRYEAWIWKEFCWVS
jgi:hypothetical protein